MIPLLRKSLLACSCGLAIAAVPTWLNAADDPPKKAKGEDKNTDKKDSDKKSEPPAKLPDFAKDYASAGEVSGIVYAADADTITIRFDYRVATGKKSTKAEHKDVDFKYVEGGLARTKVVPMKADAKGKMVKFSSAELEPLKKPQGAPGYHVDRADVKPGAVVTLELIRPKSIPATKATMEDKVIKFAVITGETTPPKMSSEEGEKAKEKMKEKAKEKAKEKKNVD